MSDLTLRQKLAAFFATWGPASMSYGMLAAAQFLIGSSMPIGTGFLMIALSLLGVVSIFIHKGKSFDEARARGGKSAIPLPWSFKSTHIAVCVGMIFVCSALPDSGLMRTPELAYAAAVFSVLAGWLASMAPGRETPPAKAG